MIERLWQLPPRVRIRVQDLNPETGRQRIDPETGERVWTHEDVNAVMYAFGVVYMVLHLLVVLLCDELRAGLSPSYRLKRDRETAEFLEQKRKQRERYAKKEDA
jgi:hypothetical protein